MKRLIALTTAIALATVTYFTPTGAAVESALGAGCHRAQRHRPRGPWIGKHHRA